MLFDLNQTMQYSTWESWIPCDTEVQLLCPSKPSPWSKVRRACTQWLPKNLVSRLTLVHCFSSCPLALPSSLSGSGCWVFWLGMTWFPGVSLLSSRGVVNWSLSCDPTSVALPAGATAPCLHLPALEHVGHMGFAVPHPPGWCFLAFPVSVSCGSGAYSKESLWRLKSSPNKFSFLPLLCVCFSASLAIQG